MQLFGFQTPKNTRFLFIAYVLFSVLYFLWYGLVVGLNSGNIAFYFLISILLFCTTGSRRFLLTFLPFVIYLLLYESLRILHEYNIFNIHNEALYQFELKWFGFNIGGQLMTLNEFFLTNKHIILDIYSGIFYISWVPFPLLFTTLLFFKGWEKLAFRFWLCFLITNIFGFIIYITLPAAPPWYYLQYGAEINLDMVGQSAGLAAFDNIIGFPLYENMYAQSSNVYGALPSMHAAFPLILSYYSLRYKNWLFTGLFVLSLTGIWFGAVYTTHHYVVDLLAGIFCAILGIIITEKWFNKQSEKGFLHDYQQKLVKSHP